MKDKIDSSLIGPAQASLFRSNDQIEQDVRELIRENNMVESKDLQVTADQGLVTLRGRVRDSEARDAAEHAARDVLGVIDVRNELEMAA